MFKKKLEALNYTDCKTFDASDGNQYRSVIVWLEDNVIRHLTSYNRTALRDIQSSDWSTAFDSYLASLQCPFTSNEPNSCLEWLLQFSLNQHDDTAPLKTEELKSSHEEKPRDLIGFDVAAPQFCAVVQKLARFLHVPIHADIGLTCLALCKLITSAVLSRNSRIEGVPISLAQVDARVSVKESSVHSASSVLRLLFIQDIRELQTSINELIVGVQKLIANPRTDTRIGVVGR